MKLIELDELAVNLIFRARFFDARSNPKKSLRQS